MAEEKSIDLAAMHAPLYHALGEALSAFSGIESALALIFARFMGTDRFNLALIAFDAINLTSPKLRVLRAVAKHQFDMESLDPKQEFDKLNRLLKRVEARADLRVKLAHWTVSMWSEKMPISNFDENIEARLVPPWNSSKNLFFNPTESVSLPEITSFTTKCRQLNLELVNYYMAMANWEKRGRIEPDSGGD